MKSILIIFILFSQVSFGQNWDEWTRQKRTQRKYLLEQILALKQFGNYLGKGYSITTGGLNVIGGLKQGCYSQDNQFFVSLRIVSPRIKQCQRVAGILSIQLRIAKAIQHAISYAVNSGQFSSNEVGYLRNVYNKVTDECEADLDRLMNVIADSELDMSDDERILEIDRLYMAAIDKQSFVQSITNDAKRVVIQRFAEAQEVKKSKILNGIK